MQEGQSLDSSELTWTGIEHNNARLDVSAGHRILLLLHHITASLGFCEAPVQHGRRRIRWTCVSELIQFPPTITNAISSAAERAYTMTSQKEPPIESRSLRPH